MFKKSKFKKNSENKQDSTNNTNKEREKDLKTFIDAEFEDNDPIVIINENKNKSKIDSNEKNENNTNTDNKEINSFNNRLTNFKQKGIKFDIPNNPKQVQNQNTNQSITKPEENSSSIKKIFLSEALLEQAKSPEELRTLLGHNQEDIEKKKELNRSQVIEMQRELYRLPKNLKPVEDSIEDHVDNLIKLAAAGMIEVPLPLEQKLKNVEETETLKKHIIDNKLAEEIDYLKVLKKLGPSYAKGYKSDIGHKRRTQLNFTFENVFDNPNSRKRKLNNERNQVENQRIEEDNN